MPVFALPEPEQTTTAHAGLLAGTRVMTAEGELPVELLGVGDRIITRRGMARLVGVDLRSVANATVVTIAADTLGFGRPAEGITLAADQRVVLRDWRAQVLWSESVAAVPVSRLVDGSHICSRQVPVAHFVTLRFAHDTVITVAGMDLCCPADQTVLAKVPA
jgi:hypothetical protein